MDFFNITLNSNDMSSTNLLSNGDLTCTNEVAKSGVRATHGKISGKWYWEVKLDNGGLSLFIGISNKLFPITSASTSNTNWRAYNGANGAKYPGATSYGTSLTVGDIIGIALDLDNDILEFYRNGESMGVSDIYLKQLGEVFPTLVFWQNVHTTITFNFGATPFSYPIPHKFYSYDGRQFGSANKLILLSKNKTYSIAAPEIGGETAIPTMTSNTFPYGRAFASSIYSTTYDAWKAFNNIDDSEGYMSANGSGGIGYLGYEFVNPIVIGKYALRSMNHTSSSLLNRMPKDWNFEGSNDGISWIILDTQVNQSWTNINTNKEFILDESKINLYKMYRLNWTSNSSDDNYTDINELKMYEGNWRQKIKYLPNQSEQIFIKHGMESPINISQLDGVKLVESNSTTHELSKKFTHTIDLSKRRVDKIIL